VLPLVSNYSKERNQLPLTKVKYFFTGIYRCFSSNYNVFITYIVFYYEIQLKYCQDTDVYNNNTNNNNKFFI